MWIMFLHPSYRGGFKASQLIRYEPCHVYRASLFGVSATTNLSYRADMFLPDQKLFRPLGSRWGHSVCRWLHHEVYPPRTTVLLYVSLPKALWYISLNHVYFFFAKGFSCLAHATSSMLKVCCSRCLSQPQDVHCFGARQQGNDWEERVTLRVWTKRTSHQVLMLHQFSGLVASSQQ